MLIGLERKLLMLSKNKVKVNISSTFPARTRCKYCLGLPTKYYYIRNPNCWISPKFNMDLNLWLKHNLKRISKDFYVYSDPNTVKSFNIFNHKLSYKGFRIRLHKNKGIHPFMDYMEILRCPCHKTSWAFYQKSAAYRPDIINKKGKYGHKSDYII